jgi:hypothetical protein
VSQLPNLSPLRELSPPVMWTEDSHHAAAVTSLSCGMTRHATVQLIVHQHGLLMWSGFGPCAQVWLVILCESGGSLGWAPHCARVQTMSADYL